MQILYGTAAVMQLCLVGYTNAFYLFISCVSGNEEECLLGEYKMKKLIAMLLVLVLAFSLIACSAKTSFTVVTTDLDGKETTHKIKTDAATVGEALLAEGLIDGEDSDYGLYITTVNGITLDWEKDGKYWAFYINGEYAMTGVDATNAEDGAVYTFKPE